MNVNPELQAASDALLHNLDRLRELEEEKRSVPLGSPRLVELAAEIEQLAATVLGASGIQEELARLSQAMVREGEAAADATIESTSSPRDVHAVLADWRDAERQLTELQPDSPDAGRIRAQIEVFKMEYRRALDAATQRRRTPPD